MRAHLKPLENIRVLDLTRILTGPFATMKLADMGAEVIKVEVPGAGDDTRGWGPPFINGESAYFLSVNRGKKSVALNLKATRGKEILEKLVRVCDVVAENFRPGTLERLGFSYQRIHEINPRAVYCSISGYGHSGRRKDDASYDLIVQGESGLMDLTGQPNGPPTKVGISIADVVGGMLAAEGILAALYQRERTGRGQHVDISLLDGLISLFTYQTGIYFATGLSPKRMGNLHPTIAPYEPFETKDGFLNLTVGNDVLWAQFCELIGKPELRDDRRFMTNADRVRNRPEMRPILQNFFKERTTGEWLDILARAGIPAGRVNTVKEMCESDVLADRDMVVEFEHRKAGRVKVIGNPVKLSDGETIARLPPPLLGEHTVEVLKSLGYPETDIDTMKREGVVGVPEGSKSS